MSEESNGPTGCDVGTGVFGLIGKGFDIFGGAATADAGGAMAGIKEDAAAKKQIITNATQAQVEALLAQARVTESRTEAANAISLNTYDMGNPTKKLS